MRHILKAAGLGLALALTLTACGGSDDATISSADRTKASAAALTAVGGGAVTDAERGDSDDSFAYEVEVTLENGTDIDVELDEDFKVTNNPPKSSDFVAAAPATPSATPSVASPTTPTTDLDDRPLTGDTLAKASAAALKETGRGTVTETSGSDDADHVYEVEVQFSNGQDVTVELDKNFKVTRVDK